MKKIFKISGIAIGCFILLLAITFVIGYISNRGEYPVPKTVTHDKTLPSIQLGDALFHCETFGSDSNPVAIVIHGGPGDDYKNLLSLKELADQYHVIFYDQQGAGLSPRVEPSLLTIEMYLGNLHRFVEYFGKGDPVNLIGHSWGAMLTSKYLGSYPEFVNKAVLAEPGFLNTDFMTEFMEKTNGFAPKMSMGFVWHMTKSFFKMLHVKETDDQARMDFFMLAMMTAPSEDNPILGYFCNRTPSESAFDKWRFGSAASMAVMKMIKNKDGEFHIDMVSDVEKFNRGVLFMASECNTIIGKEHQSKQMKLFPNSKLVVVKDAGHLMFGDQPESSVRMVRTFLNETAEGEPEN